MSHIILTGATGRAGSAILMRAIGSPAISRITILSRRPVKLAESQTKVNVLIHKDFTEYPSDTLAKLRGADACIWALGVSSVGMSEGIYTLITYDYALAAAKAFTKVGKEGTDRPFKFIFVSGEGASLEEKGALFARVKGKTENALIKLGRELDGLSVYNVRPAGIDTEAHHLRDKKASWEGWLMYLLGPFLRRFAKSWVISTDALAKACLSLATGDGKPLPKANGIEMEGRLVRNTALRKMAEQSTQQ